MCFCVLKVFLFPVIDLTLRHLRYRHFSSLLIRLGVLIFQEIMVQGPAAKTNQNSGTGTPDLKGHFWAIRPAPKFPFFDRHLFLTDSSRKTGSKKNNSQMQERRSFFWWNTVVTLKQKLSKIYASQKCHFLKKNIAVFWAFFCTIFIDVDFDEHSYIYGTNYSFSIIFSQVVLTCRSYSMIIYLVAVATRVHL